jgi:hypothetical protein
MGGAVVPESQASKSGRNGLPETRSACATRSAVLALPSRFSAVQVVRIRKNVSSPTVRRSACTASAPRL